MSFWKKLFGGSKPAGHPPAHSAEKSMDYETWAESNNIQSLPAAWAILNDPEWILWLTEHNGVKLDDSRLRLFACDYAAQVLPYFEKKYPEDKRPRQAVATARRFANGKATKEEMEIAHAACEQAVAHSRVQVVAPPQEGRYSDADILALYADSAAKAAMLVSSEDTGMSIAKWTGFLAVSGFGISNKSWIQRKYAKRLRSYFPNPFKGNGGRQPGSGTLDCAYNAEPPEDRLAALALEGEQSGAFISHLARTEVYILSANQTPFFIERESSQVLPFFSSVEFAEYFIRTTKGLHAVAASIGGFQKAQLRAGEIVSPEWADCQLILNANSKSERLLTERERESLIQQAQPTPQPASQASHKTERANHTMTIQDIIRDEYSPTNPGFSDRQKILDLGQPAVPILIELFSNPRTPSGSIVNQADLADVIVAFATLGNRDAEAFIQRIANGTVQLYDQNGRIAQQIVQQYNQERATQQQLPASPAAAQTQQAVIPAQQPQTPEEWGKWWESKAHQASIPSQAPQAMPPKADPQPPGSDSQRRWASDCIRLRCRDCKGQWEMSEQASARFRATDVAIMAPCPTCGGERYATNA